jgi:hypothetical protein
MWKAGDRVTFSIPDPSGRYAYFAGAGRALDPFDGDQADVQLADVAWRAVEDGFLTVDEILECLDAGWDDDQAFVLADEIVGVERATLEVKDE